VSENRPLSFHVKSYTGKKADLKFEFQQRVEATNKVEEYLNAKRILCQPKIFTVFEIAQALFMHEEAVREVLLHNGHGYNGITC
jgi:hypothetical protein